MKTDRKLSRTAAFLDRDGVINVDHGYVHRPEQFEWVAGAPAAIKWLNEHGFLVIVVTNQAGIARGYYSEQQFLKFMEWINARLKEYGAHLDATYYCPHHPHEGVDPYVRICECRKPAPQLLRKAISDWNVDVKRSVMIGDKESDILAACNAGLTGELFPGGNLLDFVNKTFAPLIGGRHAKG